MAAEHVPTVRGEDTRQPGVGSHDEDADTLALEKALSDVTGLKVTISHGQKGGDLKISYKTLEQLDELCRRVAQLDEKLDALGQARLARPAPPPPSFPAVPG